MKWLYFSIFFLLSSGAAKAQDTSKQKLTIDWSLFADVYYAYDFNKPSNHEKAPFIYNYKRHNEFNLNLALIQASLQYKNLRSVIGIQAGTYPQYNYAGEQELLRHIYQANVGVKLSAKKELWLDAGILPSHIGYESAISKDCWTLTRSMAAENSPYYESGVRLAYTSKNQHWQINLLALNGWQRIQRTAGNNTPAFGLQMTYTRGKLLMNWSNYIGNEYADSVRRWRYFHDFYAVMQLSNSWGLTVGTDIGSEQKFKNPKSFNVWFTPTVVLQFKPNSSWAIAARGEYYSDEHRVIINVDSLYGFKTYGASLNIDRKINDHFWWRTEFRTLESQHPVFNKGNFRRKNNSMITTSIALSF